MKIHLSGYKEINHELQQSLFLFYAPILKYDAISLYMILMSLIDEKIIEVQLLSQLTQKTQKELMYLRTLLEQYHLVRTYVDEAQNLYIDIQKPLNPSRFTSNMLYSRVLFSKLDETSFKIITNMTTIKNEFQSLKEITSVIDLTDEMDILIKEEEKFENVQAFNIEHQFDYATFIKYSQPLMIPTTIIENQNVLRKIGEYASIYHIDATNMAKFVAKSTNLSTATLDFKKLVNYISRAKIVANEKETTHPIQFLMKQQNNTLPTVSERKLIEKLFTEYHLDSEKINLLLAHSLEKNDHRIVENYIEKIAASWIRKNIKTLEEAKQTLVSKKKENRLKRMEASWENVEEEDVEIDLEEIMRI